MTAIDAVIAKATGALILEVSGAPALNQTFEDKGWKTGVWELNLPRTKNMEDVYTHSVTNAEARAKAWTLGASRAILGFDESEVRQSNKPVSIQRRYMSFDSPYNSLDNSLHFIAAEFYSCNLFPMAHKMTSTPSKNFLIMHFEFEPTRDHEPVSLADMHESMDKFSVINGAKESSHTPSVVDILRIVQSILPDGVSVSAERQFIRKHLTVIKPKLSDAVEKGIDSAVYKIMAGSPYVAEPHENRVTQQVVIPKPGSTWRSVVMRKGIAFIIDNDEASDAMEIYSRTIYLDCFLLALMQVEIFELLSDRFVSSSIDDADEIDDLMVDFHHFRHHLWWRNVSQSGHQPGDLILQKAQSHFSIVERLDQLVADLERAGEVSKSIRARRLDKNQLLSNKLLFVISIIIAPFGIIYAAAAIAVDPSWVALLLSTGLGGVAAFVGYVIWAQSKGIKRGKVVGGHSRDRSST